MPDAIALHDLFILLDVSEASTSRKLPEVT